MQENQDLVKNYFNKYSKKYQNKYSKNNIFYEYFFYERLEKATRDFDFNNKNILDIGHGTGELYQYIKEKNNINNFYASDISCDMLAQSKLDTKNKFCGNCYDIDFEIKKFDFIFMLGVSTYIQPEELNKILLFVSKSLNSNGTFIVTFSNRNSIDNIIRDKSKFLIKLLYKDKIVSQKFTQYFYTLNEAKLITNKYFTLESTGWLNHTFFPFSRLLPSLSIKFAKYLRNKKIAKNRLSSDMIFFLKSK